MRIWNTSQNWIQNSHNMHPFCSHHNLGSTCHHPYYISYQIKTTCPKKITEEGQVRSTSQQVQIMEYPIQTSHSQTQAEWLLWSPSVSVYQWHWHSDSVTTVYAAGDMVIRLVATDSDAAVAQLVVMLNRLVIVGHKQFLPQGWALIQW